MLQVTSDVARVVHALRDLLSVLEAHPIRRSHLNPAWKALRSAFGGEALADSSGLKALVWRSTALSTEARDALCDVVDSMTRGPVFISAHVFDDAPGAPDPTPEQIQAHERAAHRADDSMIRRTREQLRRAITLLDATSPRLSSAAAPVKPRGRRSADAETIQAEAALAAKWGQARDGGSYKPDFAREHGMTVRDLDRLLGRVAKRRASE
jgi:hypothetical protein